MGLLATLPWAAGAQARIPAFPQAPLSVELLRRRLEVPGLGAGWDGLEGHGVAGAGWRMLGCPYAVGPDDSWHWGSITKAVTATLLACAVEAGELAWDEPMLARLGLSADDYSDWQDVTLLHLLSHRSGFPRLDNDSEMGSFPCEDKDPRAARLALTALTLARPPEAAPGDSFIYSNRNYVAAAAMLEVATGKPWEVLVTERVFVPLGMVGAGFGAPGTPGKFDEPIGHAWWPGERGVPHPPGVQPCDNPAVAGPAARLHAPLSDMMAFLAAHRDQAPLLRAETWDRLHTPPFGGNYALGWVVCADGSLWHDGSNNLWTAQVLVRGETTRALATNWGDHQRLATPLEQAIRA